MNMQSIVADGALWVAVLVALAAGLVSFASPCVLPLVPGYLGYVSATAGPADEAASSSSPAAGAASRRGGRSRGRTLAGSLLFVAGFTAVLVLFLAAAGTVGVWLLTWQWLITRVLGVLVMLMGVVFLGGFSRLQRTRRVLPKPRVGLLGAPLLGAGFALGWTPCLGPTLTVIMSLSLQQGSVPRAVILAVAYCLGLGLPFVLLAAGLGWASRGVGWLRAHVRGINVAGGVTLVVIGVLMVSGAWDWLMSSVQAVVAGYATPL